MDDRRPTTETIKQLVRAMSTAWLDGRIDDLHAFFAEDVVMVPPGSAERIVGRAAMVEGFRHYVEQATTHRFEETDLRVDDFGATAVATLAFTIRYALDGPVYEEAGTDILVLMRSGGSWRIVWRTQVIHSSEQEAS